MRSGGTFASYFLHLTGPYQTIDGSPCVVSPVSPARAARPGDIALRRPQGQAQCFPSDGGPGRDRHRRTTTRPRRRAAFIPSPIRARGHPFTYTVGDPPNTLRPCGLHLPQPRGATVSPCRSAGMQLIATFGLPPKAGEEGKQLWPEQLSDLRGVAGIVISRWTGSASLKKLYSGWYAEDIPQPETSQ